MIEKEPLPELLKVKNKERGLEVFKLLGIKKKA